MLPVPLQTACWFFPCFIQGISPHFQTDWASLSSVVCSSQHLGAWQGQLCPLPAAPLGTSSRHLSSHPCLLMRNCSASRGLSSIQWSLSPGVRSLGRGTVCEPLRAWGCCHQDPQSTFLSLPRYFLKHCSMYPCGLQTQADKVSGDQPPILNSGSHQLT